MWVGCRMMVSNEYDCNFRDNCRDDIMCVVRSVGDIVLINIGIIVHIDVAQVGMRIVY